MTIIPFPKDPSAPDHHTAMLNDALSIDPFWTADRVAELEHASRMLDDELHIALAGDLDVAPYMTGRR